MSLNDLERQNRGFYGFFGDFGLWDTFQERIVPKPFKIDMKKQQYEVFSIERRFWWFKSQFSRFKETCAWGHQRAVPHYPHINCYFTLLASLSSKWLQIGMGMLPITISTSDELFSRINIADFERPWTSKIRFFLLIFAIFSCSAHSKNGLWWNGWR